jgi:hypothetical protein
MSKIKTPYGNYSIVFSAAIAFFFMLIISFPSGADELPKFRQGKWIFNRTLSGQSREMRRCIDPNEDLLLRGGCKISSVKKSGNIYTFTALCTVKSPSGTEESTSSTVTLDVKSDSFYQVVSERMVQGNTVKDYLDARRLGDCDK